MDSFDSIINFISWLAMPISLLIVLLLIIFLVIRPFFANLFDVERMTKIADEERKREIARRKRELALANENSEQSDDAGLDFIPEKNKSENVGSGEDISGEALGNNRESAVDKTADMIKKWIHTDE